MRKKKNRYINNKDFWNAIVDYYNNYEKYNNKKFPKYLIDCILEMVNRVGHKKNFRYYTYLTDMKQEAIISCYRALIRKKFDPNKSENPFAYFTSCIQYAFLGVIKRENRQVELQEKIYSNERETLFSASSEEDCGIKDFIDEYYLQFNSYNASSKNLNNSEEYSSEVRTYKIPK